MREGWTYADLTPGSRGGARILTRRLIGLLRVQVVRRFVAPVVEARDSHPYQREVQRDGLRAAVTAAGGAQHDGNEWLMTSLQK